MFGLFLSSSYLFILLLVRKLSSSPLRAAWAAFSPGLHQVTSWTPGSAAFRASCISASQSIFSGEEKDEVEDQSESRGLSLGMGRRYFGMFLWILFRMVLAAYSCLLLVIQTGMTLCASVWSPCNWVVRVRSRHR